MASKPKFALARMDVPVTLFWVEGVPTATDSRKSPSWTPHVRLATTWDSRYAAKRAAKLLSVEDVSAYPVPEEK